MVAEIFKSVFTFLRYKLALMDLNNLGSCILDVTIIPQMQDRIVPLAFAEKASSIDH